MSNINLKEWRQRIDFDEIEASIFEYKIMNIREPELFIKIKK